MDELKEMIKEFQCPGCINGCEPDECDSYKLDGTCCDNHRLGTFVGGVSNPIALGLPKGFNKPGYDADSKPNNKMLIRLFTCLDDYIGWDHLNVPVWALEEDGYLFVRTFCPRINVCHVDVIKGATLEDTPSALDVSKFAHTID